MAPGGNPMAEPNRRSAAVPNDLEAFWVPFTPNRAFKRAPRLIARAKDMHYYTPENRAVLDGTAGLWCTNAGHNREPIVEAIKRQAEELDYAPAFQFAHPKSFELASRIAALAPADLDRVFFCNSGSEAVDTALKIALAYHNVRGQAARTRLIGRERGYHGVGFGGISVGGIVSNRKHFGTLLAGVDHLPATYSREHQAFTKGEPEWGAHLADDLERLVALHDASTIAAVIVEPMAGSTGVLPPPKGYLERLRAICDRHGILLIFDEVITGFGRLGHAFAAERYGVTPDMITFAKGITSGAVPMGGVIARQGAGATLCRCRDSAQERAGCARYPHRWAHRRHRSRLAPRRFRQARLRSHGARLPRRRRHDPQHRRDPGADAAADRERSADRRDFRQSVAGDQSGDVVGLLREKSGQSLAVRVSYYNYMTLC